MKFPLVFNIAQILQWPQVTATDIPYLLIFIRLLLLQLEDHKVTTELESVNQIFFQYDIYLDYPVEPQSVAIREHPSFSDSLQKNYPINIKSKEQNLCVIIHDRYFFRCCSKHSHSSPTEKLLYEILYRTIIDYYGIKDRFTVTRYSRTIHESNHLLQ